MLRARWTPIYSGSTWCFEGEMTDSDTEFDRACATFLGLAVGDALGMPSQTLSRDEISRHYGTISEFVAPIHDHQPYD